MKYYLPLAAAAIITVLATIHLVYTLRDMFGEPRYFTPRDRALMQTLRTTKLSLAPTGHDFWSATLGFHLTHSIGLLLFALLIVLSVTTPLPALRPLLIGVALLLTLIAWRCWFHIPLMGCAAVSALLIAGWAF
jgi:hypothetical protein